MGSVCHLFCKTEWLPPFFHPRSNTDFMLSIKRKSAIRTGIHVIKTTAHERNWMSSHSLEARLAAFLQLFAVRVSRKKPLSRYYHQSMTRNCSTHDSMAAISNNQSNYGIEALTCIITSLIHSLRGGLHNLAFDWWFGWRDAKVLGETVESCTQQC